jgi:hypothetical protein
VPLTGAVVDECRRNEGGCNPRRSAGLDYMPGFEVTRQCIENYSVLEANAVIGRVVLDRGTRARHFSKAAWMSPVGMPTPCEGSPRILERLAGIAATSRAQNRPASRGRVP